MSFLIRGGGKQSIVYAAGRREVTSKASTDEHLP